MFRILSKFRRHEQVPQPFFPRPGLQLVHERHRRKPVRRRRQRFRIGFFIGIDMRIHKGAQLVLKNK